MCAGATEIMKWSKISVAGKHFDTSALPLQSHFNTAGVLPQKGDNQLNLTYFQ